MLPRQYHQCYRILVDDILYAFKALPFGWAYSPLICREILAKLVGKANVKDVVVLIYWVLGF